MARKKKLAPGGRPVQEPERIAPVAAAIREFLTAPKCPVHTDGSCCLRYCADRDEPPAAPGPARVTFA